MVTEALNSALDRDIDEAGHFSLACSLAWRLHAKHYGTSRAQSVMQLLEKTRAGLETH